MGEHTLWVTIPRTSLVTRIHYPRRAGRLLIKLDGYECHSSVMRYIVRRMLKLIGVWQEYRATRTVYQSARFIAQYEIDQKGGRAT